MSDVVSGQQVEEHDPTMYDYAASKLGLTGGTAAELVAECMLAV